MGQCNECQRKKLAPERGSTDLVNASEAPPVVHEVLRVPSKKIQAKLKVSQPNDKYEQEADRIADQIMRMPEPSVTPNESAIEGENLSIQRLEKLEDERDRPEENLQLKPLVGAESIQRQELEDEEEKDEEDEILQTKRSSSQVPGVTPSIETGIQSLQQNGGHVLPPSVRTFMEPRFGSDFSGVRVHTNNMAADLSHNLHARAFTVGKNIIFGRGEFQQNTTAGRRLVAHELTHVIQQGGTNIRSSSNLSNLVGAQETLAHMTQYSGLESTIDRQTSDYLTIRRAISPGTNQGITPPANIHQCSFNKKIGNTEGEEGEEREIGSQMIDIKPIFDAQERARKAVDDLDKVVIGQKPPLGKKRRLTRLFQSAFGNPTRESINHVRKVLKAVGNVKLKRNFKDALNSKATWIGCAEDSYDACGVTPAIYVSPSNSVPGHIAFCSKFFRKSKRQMEELAFHELVHNAFDILGIKVSIDVYRFNRLFSGVSSLKIPQSISQDTTLSAGNSLGLINPDSILSFAYRESGGVEEDSFSRFGIKAQGREEIAALRTALGFMQQWIVVALPRLKSLQTEIQLALQDGGATKWDETDSSGNPLIKPFVRATATLLSGGVIDGQSNIKHCNSRLGFAIQCPKDGVQPTNRDLTIVNNQVENVDKLHKSLLGEVEIRPFPGHEGFVPNSQAILGLNFRRVKRGKKAQAVEWSKGKVVVGQVSSDSVRISDSFFALKSPGVQVETLLKAFVPATLPKLNVKESDLLIKFIIGNGIRPDSESSFLGEIAFTPRMP
jgi:hypothetical protein